MTSSDLIPGSTILIADDEPALRDLLTEILADAGAQVIAVASGSAALDTLTESAVDLAILDIRMPEPSGLAVLQQLREEHNMVPVLMITGFSSATIAIEATSAGAFDYLPKPFDIDTVLVVVNRALAHRRALQQSQPTAPQTASDPRDTIIGQSGAMQTVYKLIGRVANGSCAAGYIKYTHRIGCVGECCPHPAAVHH